MPQSPDQLRNTYYALRHGFSIPNELAIILSDPTDGPKPENGLTEKGKGQILTSIQNAHENGWFQSKTVVIASSPFSRTMDGTNIAKNFLQENGIAVTTETHDNLRERWFGSYEKQSNKNYDIVYVVDETDASHDETGVEHAQSVLDRELAVIDALEEKYDNAVIILSGHGDPLQILETWFHGIPSHKHRSLKHLVNAELRPLNASL